MQSLRTISLAACAVAASVWSASAQIVGFPPQPYQQPALQPFQQQQPPQQQQVCNTFVPMREEIEKVMAGLKAAKDRKAPREEFCALFKRLSAGAGKISKFMVANKQTCGIPDQVVQQSKNDLTKSMEFQKQACASGPPAGAGPAPSLSEVLGSPILPESSTNRPDMGTFNTLTGNPLTTR